MRWLLVFCNGQRAVFTGAREKLLNENWVSKVAFIQLVAVDVTYDWRTV